MQGRNRLDSTPGTPGAVSADSAATALRKGRPQLSRLDSLSVHMDISEIMEYLYLGAKTVSQDGDALADMGIRHIVNCTVEEPNHFEARGVKYLRVAVEDSPDADIANFLEPAHLFIESARKEDAKVLVHCTMGMSRSSTIVLAHLMYDGMRLKDAMTLAKAKRSMVSPNSTFMAQLLELETKLFGSQSIDLGLYKKSRFDEVTSFAC
ncbi:Dual specificity protein phosphatase, putative [Hondaea fermentalgiana]|uniref:protein-tyrosine-phosphatase n=1 Tax=Hondaea fermentalgiana TaxID=2315210 RepID=A0A2R5G9V3_9STRA|nr:Dual specificity protein phosphatase, putative [Hondaea fermentalgiana]|eukprot:GBG24444.1 Dual specificity protein phosphatase, putative [Hondaea fermentalgiana]